MQQEVISHRQNPYTMHGRAAITTVERAWMLDVDGVLLSLITKQVEPSIIDVLADRLRRGEPVTFNSGRSPLSISRFILSRLEEHLTDRLLLSQVMVVGEKGGSWGTYGPNGSLQISFDSTLTVPPLLKAVIGELVEDPEFEPLMTIESGKQTMLSVVKRPCIPLAPFHLIQPRFARLAQQIIEDFGFSTSWKIDIVSDAVEIEPRYAGKGKAAQRIMKWLEAQSLQPLKVIVIEDSLSGLAMSDALHQLQVPTEFVFTGLNDLPQRPYPVIHTQGRYEQGTIEYLAPYHKQLLADERRGW